MKKLHPSPKLTSSTRVLCKIYFFGNLITMPGRCLVSGFQLSAFRWDVVSTKCFVFFFCICLMADMTIYVHLATSKKLLVGKLFDTWSDGPKRSVSKLPKKYQFNTLKKCVCLKALGAEKKIKNYNKRLLTLTISTRKLPNKKWCYRLTGTNVYNFSFEFD